MELSPRFLDPWDYIAIHGRKLPHWQQNRATYFLTFRLVDSIPHVKLREWEIEREIWLRAHPEPWSADVEQRYHTLFSSAIERWLDDGTGTCVLRNSSVSQLVAAVLLAANGVRYHQHSFVIMPNHIHALVSLSCDERIEKILQVWKGTSAREVNHYLRTSGALWQPNYFDRLIRNEKHFWNCARYIRRNPSKARLGNKYHLLYESPHVKEALDDQGGVG